MKNAILMMYLVIFILVLTTMMIFSKNKTVMIEWKMMSLSSSDMSMFFLLDEKSSVFTLMVMIVTASIMIYSQFYIKKKKVMFLKILIMFMASMVMLILSPNMVTLIMGWEGLGMTSFSLIMFYQNKKSVMSSMYTMMMNRVGDITLMVAMMILMNSSSWMFLSMEYLNSSTKWVTLMTVSMFSKSAQIPFSSWLTEAMAAPTPVSALVHSSTLVTAGVYLMIRFKSIMVASGMNNIILTVAMITLSMASMNSLLEMDMKKLVALSTLSQISIMFISISTNLYSLAFFHMIMHATFKSLIFLCSSTYISNSNTQDLRKMYSTSINLLVTNMAFNVASMVLCALPFMSSFYSKEIIMEMIMIAPLNKITNLTFIILMMVTASYSLKMMIIINMNKMNLTMKMWKETGNQKISKMILLIPSVVLGNSMSWFMELNKNVIYLSITEKLVPPMMIFITTATMHCTSEYKMSKPNKIANQMLTYMWFMKNLNLMSKVMFMAQNAKMLKTTEKGMVINQVSSLINLIYKSTHLLFKTNQIHLNTTILIMVIFMMIFI
uniref:NADH:ubiquinone reductase (H(+)-translocating) n=1 Tax=Bemisia tabaci TaxID=7038 RepID=A0A343KPG2_BEMTA|nr:NADH dehydrogenase subunit 5 [Bemisia tabaci]ATJ03325.1 NADH dehydrogenase subunit 5 [Bemisia tabaci]ATJ03351.1 NADH dehydrogenase subunit 5 [Bemisia tabaci]AXI95978.1 NADH dehydrogenase subunit 5 [Bemisia tabaci]